MKFGSFRWAPGRPTLLLLLLAFLLGVDARLGSPSLIHHHGFSIGGESKERLQMLQMMDSMKAGGRASRAGTGKAMTEAQADSLVVGMSGSVLVKAAHSSQMHLRDVDLRISELTNKVEMGIRDKLTPTKEDLDNLDKSLEKPVKKSTVFIQKIQDEATSLGQLWSGKPNVLIKGRKRADAMVFVQKAQKAAQDALAAIPQITGLLRQGPAKTGQTMEKLMDFRANVEVLDTLDPIFLDDPPAKKK